MIIHALQGFAGPCKFPLSKGVPFLCLAPCCTVLRSRWGQSGINISFSNPPNPNGLKTDYLWRRILTRESLTDILENYAQVVDERTQGVQLTFEEAHNQVEQTLRKERDRVVLGEGELRL